MAYDAFDPRVDSLVMETMTLWDPALEKLSDDDKRWLSQALHSDARLASKVQYERTHTGFTRTITVTPADVERLYELKVAGR